MDLCWFCEKNQGDHDFEVVMSRNLLVESSMDSKKYVYSEEIVPIPRCKQCASYHRLRYKVRLYSLLLPFVVLGAILAILTNIKPGMVENNIIINIIIAVLTLVLSFFTGEIYRKKKWPEMFKIKYASGYSLAGHQKVAALIRNEFRHDPGKTEKLNKRK